MSAITLTITDENFAGTVSNEIHVSFPDDSVTVKDIIEARVYTEVAEYNKKLTGVFRGLVQPSFAETVLNGFRVKRDVKVDAEKQVYTALDAFQKNGFFVLVDNHQAESLDDVVTLHQGSTVSFVKLTPLVGG